MSESSCDAFISLVTAQYADGRSIRQIAKDASVSRTRVRAALEDTGVNIAPRGRGRTRPGTRLPRPSGIEALLVELYVEQRMTRKQVAEVLGVPEHRVRTWLTEFGIPIRPRGGWTREDRRRPPREIVERLYVGLDWPAREVGALTQERLQTVLATLHEHGLPVRVPNTNRVHLLLDDLYADDLVVAALCHHGVPTIPRPGALAERFPDRVALHEEMLRDLYVSCGLSVVHIELVTGQPSSTVRRELKRHGIPLRRGGGVSPFVRRQRARSVGAADDHRRLHVRANLLDLPEGPLLD